MISSTSPSDRSAAAAAMAAQQQNPTSQALPPKDSFSFGGSGQLDQALGDQPEIRPEMLARGAALASDPDYPSDAIIDHVAGQILSAPDLSEDPS